MANDTTLSWPPGLGENTDLQHWIEFKSYVFNKPTNNLNIALFIPPDALSTSYKSEYEASSLGEAGLNFLRTGESPSGKEPSIASASWDALTAAGQSFTNFQKIAAELVGMASDGAQKAMLMKTGTVLNPYIISTYKGPSEMRDHTFTFKMMPKNSGDSKRITKIVNGFKNAMLPDHVGGTPQDTPLGMFTYPDEFVIEYYINGKKLPTDNTNPMFRIGKSVLTACELDYTTQDTTLFFEGTQNPVSVEMKLAFTEINVMYRGLTAKGY
jgi:hypothetical protein